MKKIVSILTMLFFFLSLSEGQKIKNDWTEMNLHADVKSITETESRAIQKRREIIKEGSTRSKIYMFNDRGNQAEVRFNDEGSVCKRITSDYDDAGKLVAMTGYRLDETILWKSVSKYDASGCKIEMITYSSNDTSQGKITFMCDPDGNLIETTEYGPDGSILSRSSYKYDGTSNRIEESHYLPESDTWVKIANRFDERGNKIESSTLKPDGTIFRNLKFIYDANNNMIEEQGISGDLLKGEMFNKHNYTYEYDKNLNWIKKTRFINGKPNSITERVIEYFN